MKTSVTFHPQQIRTPEETQALRRFQEVQASFAEVRGQLAVLDGRAGVDQDPAADRVALKGYRAEDGSRWSGRLSVDGKMELQREKAWSDRYADHRSRSTFQQDDSGSLVLKSAAWSESSFGGSQGIGTGDTSRETFTANPGNGTITYTRETGRRLVDL